MIFKTGAEWKTNGQARPEHIVVTDCLLKSIESFFSGTAKHHQKMSWLFVQVALASLVLDSGLCTDLL